MPPRRGPVANGDQQGCASGRQRDTEDPTVRCREIRLAYPAAEQVLHGGGLGCDVRVGMLEKVRGDVAMQPIGVRSTSLRRRKRRYPPPANSLCRHAFLRCAAFLPGVFHMRRGRHLLGDRWGGGASPAGIGAAVGCGGGGQGWSS